LLIVEVEVAHWNLKGCPRCGGDTYIDKDLDGWYESCLMCGYSGNVPNVSRATVKAGADAKEQPEETPDTASHSGAGIS
jgi:ribosomal protein S27AE